MASQLGRKDNPSRPSLSEQQLLAFNKRRQSWLDRRQVVGQALTKGREVTPKTRAERVAEIKKSRQIARSSRSSGGCCGG